MHLEAGLLASPAEPVAHLLVFGRQRQPPHAALRRGAELRRLVNAAPEARGIDLQVGEGSAHAAVSLFVVARLLRSMARRRGGVNRGTSASVPTASEQSL